MSKRSSPPMPTTGTRHGGKEKMKPAPDTPAPGGTPGPWGAILYILPLWGVSRVILSGIGAGARSWIGQSNGPGNIQRTFGIGTGQAWLDTWSAWDSYWYYTIADLGYLATPRMPPFGHSAWGFFPLYPWMTGAVAEVVGDTYIAGLIVSNAALLFGAWCLYTLVEQHHDIATARKAVLFLFVFPTAYVFSCLMTEGLFFGLSVGAWHYARRGNWLLAGVLGMGSAMTRLLGLFMAPLLALEYLRQRRWRIGRIRPNVLWIGLVPAGLVVFMAFCSIMTGNPLEFVEAQNTWVQPGLRQNPLRILWESIETTLRGNYALRDGTLAVAYGTIATIAVTGVLLWGRQQIGVLLLLWSVTLILMSVWSRPLSAQSMPRYLVVIFPVFMILASIRMKHEAFIITVVTLGLLQVATFVLWTLGKIMAL